MTALQAISLIGTEDRNLKTLSDCFGKEISFRDNTFTVQNCDDVICRQITDVIHALYEVAKKNQPVTEQDVIYACRLVSKSEEVGFEELGNTVIGRTLTGKTIAPKTKGQLAFVRAMEQKSIVFAIGPAGTGKTYLAVIKAVSSLKKGEVKRIVLTRPAVEAGENLGFLPGDMKEKVDPYLTPLYDALHDMLGVEQTEKLIEKGTIEIAPLAFMRGRTLDDSFVILDEAQNTTPAQMKMFLTRLGFRSKMVITGDVTQIDLKIGTKSGLIDAAEILGGIDEITILHLTSDDVVRHPLVQKIIEKYEKSR
ncbi:MAG: PhoH family protein [Solobacterium sp.]|nr:PhoH family protein [Erysipelotrichaceae bacterium]MBQ1326203.1 PhoH family protein [Solobacterium sp.]MBQ1382281.1 PhoH family protein [Solobacterium sp.]MBQ1446266.1 PhoH family protein [Solobacterium sp.]MBQ6591954.1 PhoH family protein [Solobacterium sp.]